MLHGQAARAAPSVEERKLGFRLGGACRFARGEECRRAALQLVLAFEVGQRMDPAAREQELRVVAEELERGTIVARGSSVGTKRQGALSCLARSLARAASDVRLRFPPAGPVVFERP